MAHQMVAHLIHERELSDTSVVRSVCDVLETSGYSPKAIVLSRSEIESRTPPGSCLGDGAPLLVLLLGKSHLPAWLLQPTTEVFPNSVVLIAYDSRNKTAAGIYTLKPFSFPYDVRTPERVVASLLRALAAARKLFLEDPGRYVSPDRRSREATKYEVLEAAKDVTISPSGHGYIESTQSIRVTSEEFERISHYFGLNEYAPRDLVLPSLPQLMKTRPEDRYTDKSFSYRLLVPRDAGVFLAAVETPESSARTKVFQFTFTPPVRRGQSLKYAWSWSHPHIFRTSGQDASTLVTSRSYGQVRLVYTFLCGPLQTVPPFDSGGEPSLVVRNAVGLQTAALNPQRRFLLHGVRYSWVLHEVQPNTSLEISWTLARDYSAQLAAAEASAESEVSPGTKQA